MSRDPESERSGALPNGGTRHSGDSRDEGQPSDAHEHEHPHVTRRSLQDLEHRRLERGRQPGDRYVRIVRPSVREFRRRGSGYLVATERVLEPRGVFGRVGEGLRRLLIGRRLRSELEGEERTSKLKGLAVFASDNISSSAYATEEMMRMLALAGVASLWLTSPLAILVAVVLAIVVVSYLEVIRAYPRGGGSYVVAHENLGKLPGLLAAAALLTDYILTVAVSTSAGVAAITSAFPVLFEQRVVIAVSVIVVMTIVNLRGIRESGTVFAAPTYVYVIAVAGLLLYGFFRFVVGDAPEYHPPREWLAAETIQPLSILLILRAFASGCVGLSGTEAIADCVPSFRAPEVPNAQHVLIAMGALFATIFLGISFLGAWMQVVPDPNETETVVSQIARTLVGESPYYYVLQFATAVILVLAANTAFNGFPRLASVLAQDSYLPRQFQYRGDRLAFTVGILILATVSILVVVAFSGSVTNLIPLYTIGVFLAFTLSQAGLVLHWRKLRDQDPHWKTRAIINGAGALATGIVSIVVMVSKFALGAWMVLTLIPILIAMMWAIERHYRIVQDAMTLETPDRPATLKQRSPVVIVPISRVDRAAMMAMSFARSISQDVVAVHITEQADDAKLITQRWEDMGLDIPLTIVESPYRALLQPLLAYIDAVDKQDPSRPITVVLTELVPRHFWEYILHNQTALRLKLRLFFRPNTILVDLPYHLGGDGINGLTKDESRQSENR